MTNKTLFEVQTFTLCDGWANCWLITDENGEQPETFKTEAEAQAEIDDFFEEVESQIANKERDPEDGYDRDEYRIVEILSDKYL